MRKYALTLSVAIMLAATGIGNAGAQSRVPLQKETPVLFKADNLRNEQNLGLVVATGNVEFSQGQRTLIADTVTYNRRNDTVTASGNISLIEPTGEVIFADRIDLTGDLRNGIVENIKVRLSDDARIAAAGGRRIKGQRTEFRKAVYSPCKLCEKDPSRAPIWQVKSYEISHDQKTRDVTYKDAFLEFYGIPVLYTPYLSHPDPTVERRTGFLTPTYGSDGELGLLLSTPYYIDIAPNMDATVTPIYTTNEGLVGSGQFRHRLSQSEYQIDGSATHGSTDSDDGDKFRGHIKGNLRHEFDRTWRGGSDIYLVTDDTYLKRYGFDSVDTLENRLYAEGFRGRNYASANAYYFRGLREEDVPGETPIVLPKLDFNYVSEPSRYGGVWKIDTNLLAIGRTDSTDTGRLSGKAKWELPYTSPSGDVYRVFASLQTDAYYTNDTIESDAPENTISGFSGRFFPQAGMEWRLPMARQSDGFTQVVEPIVNFILSPSSQNSDRIPNEDSRSFEFDDTNLLSDNRFSGLDRVEGDIRLAYGLHSGVFGLRSGFSSFFIGQSYRLDESEDFGSGSGLEDNFSDFVGRVRISPIRYINALYRFRLDKDSLASRRNELKAIVGVPEFRVGIDYLSIDQQEAVDIADSSDEFDDREEITIGITSQITDRWRLGVDTRRDLESGGGSLRHGAFLSYQDDCFEIRADYTRTFTQDRDIQPSDTILVRFVLKTLGEATTGSGVN